MQVFIIGTVYETAQALDPRRLWKQILEADQIIKAIDGTGKWFNHPIVLMYKNNLDFLKIYKTVLYLYKIGNLEKSQELSQSADLIKPEFLGPYLYDQMKRRLYTKNKIYYSQWKNLGESDINYYYVDGKWLQYQNGKKL